MQFSAAFLIVTVSLFLLGTTLGCRPVLRIFEGEYNGSEYVEVAREWIGVNNEPNLTAKGFQNLYLSTCPEGLWLGYQHENYTGETAVLHGRYNGLSTCIDERYRDFRSVKIIGSTADYNTNAVVTYTRKWAEGEDNTFFNHTSRMEFPFNSVIITGSSEVELFSGSYFNGLSVCVRPNNGQIWSWTEFERVNQLTNGTELFTELMDIKEIFGFSDFHSFKFGCSNNTNSLLSVTRYVYSTQ